MKSNCKTKSAMTALVVAAMLCTAAMPVKAAESQWVNSNGTWTYVKADGSKATGWIKEDGCWYAFDANGAMRTGWIASNEHWYFMGESGVMQSDAWVEDNGAKYYIKGTGVMAKDYVKDGYELTSEGKAIPLGESGSVVVTDPAELEGKVIEGNLYVDVTTAKELELKGVTVKGKLVVLGDNKTVGKVTLTDSTVETINTQSRNAEVVLSGKTEVKNVVIEETAKVTPDKNYKGEVENIEVQSTTKGEVVIEVPAENVSTRTYATVDVQAPVGNLEVKTDTQVKVNADVKNVTVTETAKDTTVEVAKGSTVGTITADAPVKIDGKGTVEKVEANVDGVEAGKDTTIKEVETGKDVTDVPDVTKPDKGGSSGGSGGSSGGGTDTRPTVKQLTVSKINYADNAPNIQKEAINNQKNITLTTDGDVVKVRSNTTLESYTSSNAAQGKGQWIGFIMDTGESSILGLSVNTDNAWYEFTQADIDEAATVGAGAGKFVFWMKADDEPQRTIKVRKGSNGVVKSIIIQYGNLVDLAESAKRDFDSKKGDLDWDTVITAVNSYDELAEAAKSDNSLKGKLGELEKYYASIKTLNLSDKDISKYPITTNILAIFTGLEELNLSNTHIFDLEGLVNMKSLTKLDVSNNQISAYSEVDNLMAIGNLTSIKELNLSGNRWIEKLSAIENLTNLEVLDVSDTSIMDFNIFWNQTEPRYKNLKTLTAKNIDTLISIDGLFKLANSKKFDSNGKIWDLSNSTLVQEAEQIQKIKDKFTQGTFNAPTVAKQLEDFGIVENAETKEQVIQFKALEASTGVTAYEYIIWLEDQSPIYSHVSLDKTNDINLSLEKLVDGFKQSEKVNKIIVKALKDKEVIASSALDVNLTVIVENSDEYFTVNKLNIDDENEIFEYSISSDIFKKLEFGKDTVTLFWLPISESEQNGHYTWYRIVDLKEFEDIKDNTISWGDDEFKEELKFAVNILSRGEFDQENNSYTINITYLNNGGFVSASDKAPTKAKITIEGMAEGEDKTFKPITLVNENEYGMIIDSFVPANYKDNLMGIGLNLLQGDNKKVRVTVNFPDDSVISTGNVQFIAVDSEGIAWNIVKSGWGPAEGFLIPEDIVYTDVYIVGESGTYMGGILVVDSVDETVYASEEFTFTISEEELKYYN